eukprot:TRINITY_DN10036_c0_g1_i3.p1 TRINITY_DN10036_c0_g1~~TRINITY_DN10036_c0_g1_i3.p1  ORF type:complete len:263 (-),score=37.03 TRINITY_DN10036_c0_g1_i3:37-825(-)
MSGGRHTEEEVKKAIQYYTHFISQLDKSLYFLERIQLNMENLLLRPITDADLLKKKENEMKSFTANIGKLIAEMDNRNKELKNDQAYQDVDHIIKTNHSGYNILARAEELRLQDQMTRSFGLGLARMEIEAPLLIGPLYKQVIIVMSGPYKEKLQIELGDERQQREPSERESFVIIHNSHSSKERFFWSFLDKTSLFYLTFLLRKRDERTNFVDVVLDQIDASSNQTQELIQMVRGRNHLSIIDADGPAICLLYTSPSPRDS